MKILHVVPTLRIAGAESLVVNMLKRFDRTLIDIRLCVLYPCYKTELERELIKERVPVYYLGKHKGLDIRIIGRINRLLAEFRPDVIHTHGYILRYPLMPTLLNRIPIRIHTLHTLAQHEVGFLGKILHWVAFNLFRVLPISVSDFVANSVLEVYGVPSHVIHNGIPTHRFNIIKKWTYKEKTEVIFINIGGFRPAKNHRLLVDAFAEAVKKNKNLKLLLVGDGPLRSDMEELVKERGLENNTSFLGSRNDIPFLLEKSDVYISSSEWEGFGLAIVEAMAAGKPIIATAVGAVPELVDDEINGLLVPSKDVKALSSAMSKLVNNPKLCERMGHESRKRAFENFDIEITTKKYEKLYLKLYSEKIYRKY